MVVVMKKWSSSNMGHSHFSERMLFLKAAMEFINHFKVSDFGKNDLNFVQSVLKPLCLIFGVILLGGSWKIVNQVQSTIGNKVRILFLFWYKWSNDHHECYWMGCKFLASISINPELLFYNIIGPFIRDVVLGTCFWLKKFYMITLFTLFKLLKQFLLVGWLQH